MRKYEDRIQKWRNSKQEVPVDDVEPVIRYYFPNTRIAKGTSHKFQIQHQKLIGHPDFFHGCLTIPVKNGQKVKPFYLRKLAFAIDIVSE